MTTDRRAESPAVLGLRAGDRVLVVAPHPDDETIGPGGTIARLGAQGAVVHVLCVTVRAAKMWGSHSDPTTRVTEFANACAALGVAECSIAWVDDSGDLDVSSRQRDLVDLIEHQADLSIATVDPDVLFIPSASGYHQDHLAVHRAAFAAARPQGAGLKPTPPIVLGYRGAEERWSATDEPWRVHVDTTDHWTAKAAALAAYGTQLRPTGPRSVEQIRLLDAAIGSSMDVECAESFIPYRLSYR